MVDCILHTLEQQIIGGSVNKWGVVLSRKVGIKKA